MLATMGYITPELTGKFPGYLSNSLDLKFGDIPNGLAAVSKVPGAGWFQIVAYCLYCEATGGFGYNSDSQASAPGDCGWKPPLLATDDPELKKTPECRDCKWQTCNDGHHWHVFPRWTDRRCMGGLGELR